ncbi:MAG: phage holin family protein [Candidatus Gracilibacteria bacterium]|jgi:uncharacterized membrane protein YvlD (DUF360 family)
MGFLKKIGIGIALNGLALYFLTLILEEITYTGGFKLFLISGIILGVLNSIVKPLIKLFSLPLIFLSGGLFLIVINAVILRLLVYFLVVIQFRDVTLSFPNLGSYVIGAIAFGAINWTEHLIIKNK